MTDDRGTPLGEARPSVLHSAQVLAARVPIDARWTAVAELPFSYTSFRALRPAVNEPGLSDGVSEFVVGNPYLGVEAEVGSGWTATAGGRLPVVSSGDWTFAGSRALPERTDAFRLELATVAVGLRYEQEVSRGVGLRLSLTPTLLYSGREIEPRGGAEPDPALDLDNVGAVVAYGAHAVGTVGRVDLRGGVKGIEEIDVQTDQFGVFTAGVAEVGAIVPVGSVRLGAAAWRSIRSSFRGQFPADAAVGLTLDVAL